MWSSLYRPHIGQNISKQQNHTLLSLWRVNRDEMGREGVATGPHDTGDKEVKSFVQQASDFKMSSNCQSFRLISTSVQRGVHRCIEV